MAQKVLRTTGDYSIESAGNVSITTTPGGTLTIDTGAAGTTFLTGSLTVQGTTTTVESNVVTIKDNVIVLNSGETGAGVTLITSGMEIDRGSLTVASILWNENTTRWEFYSDSETVFSPLKVSSLELDSGVVADNIDDDVLLTGNSSSAVPTQYAVKTYIDTNMAAVANIIIQDDSSVTVIDAGIGGYVETAIDGVPISSTSSTGYAVDNISSYTTDTNLTISANGTGEIVLDKFVNLPYQIAPPSTAANTNKLFAGTPLSGGTGLFFANTSFSGELVSKSKAIVYGIIF